MNNEFVGSFVAFKGEEEMCGQKNILLEITEVEGQEIEFAFTAPIHGSPRIYIRCQLPELVAHCMPEKK
jgi:hypothetical protein